MNLFLALILIFGSLLIAYALAIRFLGISRLYQSMGIIPVGNDPVWQQISGKLDVMSHRHRVARPRLFILPEFSPNALVLRFGVREAHIVLSEGLVRSLGAAEIDAILSLCLATAHQRGRMVQTWLAFAFLPFGRALQSYPLVFQIFIAPVLAFFLRLGAGPQFTYRVDSRAAKLVGPLVLAAALQKVSVLGRKIPLRRWNLALDPLFLLSPLTLDGNPIWVFLSQPSIEERRSSLLRLTSCESAPSLT